MQKMLHGERDSVKGQYWEQGFLGRFLVYLMDRIIQASITSFNLSMQEQSKLRQKSAQQSQSDPSQSAISSIKNASAFYEDTKNAIGAASQNFSVQNQEKIEKLKRVRMLKSLLADCRQVKLEYKRLKQFVEEETTPPAEAQEAQSDLIARVRALLEKKDLRLLAESCTDLARLTCLDLKNKTFAQDRH